MEVGKEQPVDYTVAASYVVEIERKGRKKDRPIEAVVSNA